MTAAPSELTDIHSLAGLLPAFEFERLIARGGMGAVYKARQRSLERDVAIKILPRELGHDPLFRASFQAEARAMARLNHPNLVKVYDYGDLDGLLYIVMEYVPGKSLFHSAHGIAIDPKQAVGIVIDVCRGLAHAHEKGIIHRDIKPANILLTLQCEPKIGDFGLARCTRSNIDGLAMGTPDYMAPELISHPERGDPRSDVHAIGVVLRELLTGIPAGTEHAAKRVVSDLTLAAICRKATHADPALRYPDTSALAGQLTHWMTSKTPKSLIMTPRPVSHRHQLARPALRAKPGHLAILRNCAIITFLLFATHLTWGIYRKGSVKPAMPSEMAESKPPQRFTPSRDLAANSSVTLKEPALPSLVRLGPALASRRDSTSASGRNPRN